MIVATTLHDPLATICNIFNSFKGDFLVTSETIIMKTFMQRSIHEPLTIFWRPLQYCLAGDRSVQQCWLLVRITTCDVYYGIRCERYAFNQRLLNLSIANKISQFSRLSLNIHIYISI